MSRKWWMKKQAGLGTERSTREQLFVVRHLSVKHFEGNRTVPKNSYIYLEFIISYLLSATSKLTSGPLHA